MHDECAGLCDVLICGSLTSSSSDLCVWLRRRLRLAWRFKVSRRSVGWEALLMFQLQAIWRVLSLQQQASAASKKVRLH